MKKLLLFFPCMIIAMIIFTGQGTNNQQPEKWSFDPRMMNLVDPSVPRSESLPFVAEDYIQGTQEYFYNTPNGILVVNPSFRVLPRIGGTTATNSWQSEVIIYRHPLNPLIMYGSSNAVTNPAGTLFISEGTYVTTNGGTSWFGSDTMKNTGGTILTGHGGDPGPVIDKNGNFIITHLGGGIKANYSTNNGVSWSNDITIITGSQDKNLSGTDDAPTSAFYGRSYTVWSRFNASLPPIAISYTTNGGVSWSAAADINSNPTGSGHYSQGCDIAVGPTGQVYVVWTQPLSGSPFTGDSVGFAKSITGGTSWATVTNRAYNMNGIRGNLLSTNIRVNDFPRISVDRTCGPRAGWIYVVTAEKNLSPAGSDADVILHRSTNEGSTWSSGVRVNQDALNNGKSQYFPVVRVDESGAVNVIYYDNRLSSSTDSIDVYLSRSLDGGVTFSDTRISDHRFKPTPIDGLNTGYSGDYIGLTSGLVAGNPVNGNQRLWPLWMDNSVSGIFQAFTTKIELLPKRPCAGCEDFSNTAFTPDWFSLEYTGTQNWTRQTPSAYGIGSGSAKYDFFNDNVRTPQSLITDFEAVGAGYYLTFDHAYAPYGTSGFGPDTLFVESSTNGGTSYTVLKTMLGIYPSGGTLNTAPGTTSAYSPANSEWRPKIFALPTGTNRVRLRAESGFGNNLYLDNICIQALSAAATGTYVGLASQGMWTGVDPYWRYLDTVRIYLARTDFPNVLVDSATATMSAGNSTSTPLIFSNALSSNYYWVARHRNSIETWSNVGVGLTRGVNTTHNFIPDGQSYGNNQAVVNASPLYRGMYSGDVDRDGAVDIADLGQIENAAAIFSSGYVVEDLTGDLFVDLADLAIADNNAAAFVLRVAPPGAGPQNNDIMPVENPTFETDFEREKYQEALRRNGERDVENEYNVNDNKVIISQERYDSYYKNRQKNQDDLAPTNENLDAKKQSNFNGKTPGER